MRKAREVVVYINDWVGNSLMSTYRIKDRRLGEEPNNQDKCQNPVEYVKD